MATIHASAVLVGARALLLRGPSGSGKSRLALEVIEAAAGGRLPPSLLVADDRVHLEIAHGRLLARTPPALAGLLEVRGLGLLRLPHEPLAVVGWVADLGTEPERLPRPEDAITTIEGVTLPRLAFTTCIGALTVFVAALRASPVRREFG